MGSGAPAVGSAGGAATESTADKANTFQGNSGAASTVLQSSASIGNADHNEEYVEENYW